MTKPKIRVLCVDDHLMVREGIAFIIDNQRDMKVIATAGTGEEAIRLFHQHRPNVTVMDLGLPGMSGVDAIHAIRAEFADARIVVLTAHHGDDDIWNALKAGAISCVLKDSVSYELIKVIREVHEGESPLSPQLTALLVDHEGNATLSVRERQVLELLATGMRNKEIAAVLSLSEMTIQAYVKRLFVKLKVKDRTAAVTLALRRGIIHLG